MKITKVDFSMGGDGRTALYKDGKLIKEGDYYHDKINEFIEGFIFALITLSIEHEYEEVVATEGNKVAWGIYENDDDIPDELQDFTIDSI